MTGSARYLNADVGESSFYIQDLNSYSFVVRRYSSNIQHALLIRHSIKPPRDRLAITPNQQTLTKIETLLDVYRTVELN